MSCSPRFVSSRESQNTNKNNDNQRISINQTRIAALSAAGLFHRNSRISVKKSGAEEAAIGLNRRVWQGMLLLVPARLPEAG
jgi:hypothetical protein